MSEPDFRSRATLAAKGNRYEDMTEGRVFEHHWGRTITSGDNAAFTTSTVFLISYVIRFATTGAHKYPGSGIDKIVYLFILFSHMVLAVVLVPLLIGALRRALRGDFIAHKLLESGSVSVGQTVKVTLERGATVTLTAIKW